MRVQNRLQAEIEFFALAQQLVQFSFAEHAAQRGLRQLRSGVKEVGHFHYRQPRLDHAKIHHRIHLDGDIVARDHVLRRHLQRIDPQRNAHHLIDRREHQNHARPFGLR